MALRAGSVVKYAGVLVVGLLLATTAHATSLDFNSLGGGTISYAGGANPLVGSDIPVDTVTFIPGGPTKTCFGCVLTFETGDFSSYDGMLMQYTFNSGGFIKINGWVDGMGIDPGAGMRPDLLVGYFSEPVTTVDGVGLGPVAINDTKYDGLLDLFLLPDVPYVGTLNLGFDTSVLTFPPSDEGFSTDMVFGGDLENTPTPEPGTLLLLGSGLAGFSYLRRRPGQG